MYKTLAVYYGGIFLIIMAINSGNFISTKNTIQGKNESPPTSYPRAIQGSQPLFGRSGGGDGK